MKEKPLLSICIPTYNRALFLKESLLSLVAQKEFNSDKIEVVISDNCSTDNTREVVEEFTSKYKNIRYFYNPENIRDKNFPEVLKRANGFYRKICNDTIIFEDECIAKLLALIVDNKKEKPVLFFLNGNDNSIEKKMFSFSSIDLFVRTASFYMTWLCSFGIWEDDILLIEDFYSGFETNLWQVKIVLELVCKKTNTIIINEKYFTVNTQIVNKDLSYGLIKVFYDNFINIYLKKMKDEGYITKKTFEYVRRKLLLKYFAFLVVNLRFMRGTILDKTENIDEMIKQRYSKDFYYPYFILFKHVYYLYRKYIKK